ncbi:dehydrogenase [Sulfobacillus acidophilus DSM 10332]|uniref:Dehydrogenase n=1 Tax=Sulfobacillus acidophilus (strain ATCC 700253 / DSM 10332 / NAL) TaxID=679936 RepID=G8TS28_SULAD|nr:dehydrogenase [Sulfobacillus acidophilus DSM 10332]
MVDVVQIARLPEAERATHMGAMFQQLMAKSPDQQVGQMRELIRQMAEQATDSEYLALCHTNLTLAAGLPEETLKGFLTVRQKAVASLPEALQQRDQTLMMKAFAELPETIQAPVKNAMQ